MLSPTIAVVTNIEADHLDNYRDLDDILDAFVEFVNKVPFYGAVVLPSDCPAVRSVADRIKRPMISFGVSPTADVAVSDCVFEKLNSRFVLSYSAGRRQECALRVPGMHNVLNAAAAFAAALEMGVGPDTIADGLEAFGGVERRFEIKSTGPVTVIDDYAHHPTEVRAVLTAARFGGFKRILVAFQPHRYSRTYHLFEDFASSFDEADTVLVTDIYAAGEDPIKGVTSSALVDRMNELGSGEVLYVPDLETIESYLREHALPGDAILILGAGNITRLADRLAEREPMKVTHD